MGMWVSKYKGRVERKGKGKGGDGVKKGGWLEEGEGGREEAVGQKSQQGVLDNKGVQRKQTDHSDWMVSPRKIRKRKQSKRHSQKRTKT